MESYNVVGKLPRQFSLSTLKMIVSAEYTDLRFEAPADPMRGGFDLN